MVAQQKLYPQPPLYTYLQLSSLRLLSLLTSQKAIEKGRARPGWRGPWGTAPAGDGAPGQAGTSSEPGVGTGAVWVSLRLPPDARCAVPACPAAVAQVAGPHGDRSMVRRTQTPPSPPRPHAYHCHHAPTTWLPNAPAQAHHIFA